MQIHYQPVTNQSDWYAPETLGCCVGLVAAVLVAGRVAGSLIVSRYGSASTLEDSPKGFRDQWGMAAGDYAPFRQTVLLLGYSFLIALISLGGCYLLGDHTYDDEGSVLLVSTQAGLPAALALLLPAAAVSFALSFIVIAFSTNYGAALVRTGLFAAIWLFALAPALAVAGLITRAPLPVLGNALLIAAVATAAAGLWLRQIRLIGGKTTLELARERKHEAQWRHARPQRTCAPEEGEYLIGELGEQRGLRPFTPAHRVRWDRNGVAVEWPGTEVKRFRWDELRELSLTSARRGLEVALVRTVSGEDIVVAANGKGYQGLLSALEVHIWGGEKPDDGK